MHNERLEIGIVGASGYGGGELLRLLARHPYARVKTAISETYAGKPITASWPGQVRQSELIFSSYGDGSEAAQCDVVFLAMENGKAMETAPHLLEAGCKIVDLSADFRFRDTDLYPKWYKAPHASPGWNAKAVYGLPELYKEEIGSAPVVGNPGCYPTAAILALSPLVAANAVKPETLIVDAKSGVSGAGRSKFGPDSHFSEVNESVKAYNIAGTHRHTPEIEIALNKLHGSNFAVTFTPHLVPMTRGILATCYADLTKFKDAAELRGLFHDFYADKPFVYVQDEGLPATKHTLGSNRCHIGLDVDSRTNRVTIVSAIDNLVKGMAGQAIQNMNIMFGFDETAGLEDAGGLWP